MSDASPSYLGLHGTALALRAQRLELLAANLANADTPNYKAQDLDFAAALRAARQAGGAGAAIDQAATAARIERPGAQPSLDGNTVDGEREHALYAQAALEYRASMTFVESKVRGMLTAITGQ